MAIYHINMTPISRGAGRSATAAAAYRSATKIQDERTGETHDYTVKRGVLHSEIVLPNEMREEGAWALAREKLWNAAEAAERQQNSRVAREVEIALPVELSPAQRLELARAMSVELAERYRCAVDLAIHKPHKEGDERNFHAHLLMTTREVQGRALGPKTTIELSDRARLKRGLTPARKEVQLIRGRWAALTNEHLKAAGTTISVDHRSLAEQGIDRPPTKHFGPVVAERLRRGKDSYVAERIRQERVADISALLATAAERGQLEREGRGLQRAILDTESTLRSALAQRDTQRTSAHEPARNLIVVLTPEEQRRQARELWLDQRHAPKDHAPDPNPQRQLVHDVSYGL